MLLSIFANRKRLPSVYWNIKTSNSTFARNLDLETDSTTVIKWLAGSKDLITAERTSISEDMGKLN